MNRHKRFREFFRFCEDIRNNVCQRSQQLRGHCVSVVNDYADTHDNIILWKKSKSDQKFNLIFSKIACQRSGWLRGQGVGVDYYADTFGKLWRFLTDFKGKISKKRYLDVLTHPISEKIGFPLSRWLCGHSIFELCDRISPQKRKFSRNRFACSVFIWGPGRIF